ncbi:hypothetical protein G6M89_17520 [Natronolimnobius sp. AArcel1]|uniref:hypothetical protein n=1 Tax=Natronolimnobius sp. AArcel1 TaxID=1679093 RepID=UPI0013EAEAA3|nr:hypothetical protein [Natronolimnobius sp. AArcel1]NGM70777.1 hypothetical protein [Natronolimnobius sp. AArcel1]
MRRPRTQLVAVLVAGVLVLSLTASIGLVQAVDELEETDGNSVEIAVVPPDDLEPNESAPATVVVEGATEGISAYELTLSLEGDAATVGDIEILAEGDSGPMTTIDHDDDEVSVGAALLEATHDPAEEIDIFEVELEGETDGTATLAVDDVTELTDADVDRYEISATDTATVQVGDGNDDGGETGLSASSPDDDDGFDSGTDPELDLEVQNVTDDEAHLEVTATNPGDEPLERTLDLESDGQSVDTSEFALEPGETTTLESAVSIPADASAVDVTAMAGNATAETEVEVEGDDSTPTNGTLDLAESQFPSEAEPGDQITAEATVTNDDSESHTASLAYAVADTQTTTDVTVAPDDTETVTLEVPY